MDGCCRIQLLRLVVHLVLQSQQDQRAILLAVLGLLIIGAIDAFALRSTEVAGLQAITVHF